MPSQTAQAKPVKPTTLAERAAARLAEENSWEQYNSETKYDGRSMQKSLKDLALKTFPADPVNCVAYQEAVVQSLTETISPEIGIKDFWKAIGKDGCKFLKIEFGHLNFYAKNGNRLDITGYTQPITFGAESSIYSERLEERAQKILEAKKQLTELMSEIQQQ
jgi:hypothetical protein